MGERRMFSKLIIDSDLFLDMPATAQLLYFHLGMCGDDEGFVNNPKKIQRSIGCTDDDLKLLIAKGFVIPFESGVIVITHWHVHNTLRKDRIKQTIFKDERQLLTLDNSGAYSLIDNQLTTICQPVDGHLSTKCPPNIREDNIREYNIRECNAPDGSPPARFKPPTVEEVAEYCKGRNNGIDPQRFVDYYTANGWKVGKNSMKDWKAAVRTWERKDNDNGHNRADKQDLSDTQRSKYGITI